jgi:hypothetical protein
MSSVIAEYRATEAAIKELQARMATLQSDGKLQEELEFEGKLRSLMGEYSKSLKDILGIMDPDGRHGGKSSKQASDKSSSVTRRQRHVKQYKNPHNGEVIETKGGNHKTLKEWKAKWGNESVESWVTILG